MEAINISEFKAKCLAILERIARTGERITILKRGRPIAQIHPAVHGGDTYPQQTLRGSVEFVGDIVDPVVASEDWEALGGEE